MKKSYVERPVNNFGSEKIYIYFFYYFQATLIPENSLKKKS